MTEMVKFQSTRPDKVGSATSRRQPDPVRQVVSIPAHTGNAAAIENVEIERCYNWLYLQKIRELNEMRERIEEWEKIRK